MNAIINQIKTALEILLIFSPMLLIFALCASVMVTPQKIEKAQAEKALECLKLENPTDKQYKSCAILLSNLK